MSCCIADLRNKEVICKSNGVRLGHVDDVEIDVCNGKLVSLILFGRNRGMGFFSRCDDIVIPWCDIDVIGEDTILVNFCCPPPPPKPQRGKWFGG